MTFRGAVLHLITCLLFLFFIFSSIAIFALIFTGDIAGALIYILMFIVSLKFIIELDEKNDGEWVKTFPFLGKLNNKFSEFEKTPNYGTLGEEKIDKSDTKHVDTYSQVFNLPKDKSDPLDDLLVNNQSLEEEATNQFIEEEIDKFVESENKPTENNELIKQMKNSGDKFIKEVKKEIKKLKQNIENEKSLTKIDSDYNIVDIKNLINNEIIIEDK